MSKELTNAITRIVEDTSEILKEMSFLKSQIVAISFVLRSLGVKVDKILGVKQSSSVNDGVSVDSISSAQGSNNTTTFKIYTAEEWRAKFDGVKLLIAEVLENTSSSVTLISFVLSIE